SSGHLATTAFDGLIRLYAYNPNEDNPNFRRLGDPVSAPSGHLPRGIAFSPDGRRLAVGYQDVLAVDILDGETLGRVGSQRPPNTVFGANGLTRIAWSADGQELLAVGS